jgi:hypothetical protein
MEAIPKNTQTFQFKFITDPLSLQPKCSCQVFWLATDIFGTCQD